MLWLALGLLAIATMHDIKSREIPDWISAALLAAAAGQVFMGSQSGGWLGATIGGLLAAILGVALFALGGLGGGDVKLLVGLGSLLGPLGFAETAFWMALSGGCLAVLYAARERRDLPYVPAILLGFVMYMVWPGGLAWVLGI